MEKQKSLKSNQAITAEIVSNVERISKKDSVIFFLKGALAFLIAFLFGSAKMLFEASPLGYALLASSISHTPFILLGVIAAAFEGGEFSISAVIGACLLVATRILSSLMLDSKSGFRKSKEAHSNGLQKRMSGLHYLLALENLFSENTHLKIMSCSIAVFLVGVWRIVEGGFRFYDLFASIFYLISAPIATFLFSKYFSVKSQKASMGDAFSITPLSERFYEISCLSILCAITFSLSNISFMGISIPLFFAIFITLFASKKGFLHGVVAGLLLGASISIEYAPMLAFCALSYLSVSKLSLFGGAIASCIAGLVFGIYVHGISALATDLPALLSASLVFSTAERLDLFDDFKRFFKKEAQKRSDFSTELILAEQKISLQDERLRSISDSFSSLSEIFYNLSSKLKRPSMLDLHSICEESFEKHCDGCENRPSCFGAEYPLTLDAMKKTAIQLHSLGIADEKKLPENFKKKCSRKNEIIKDANLSCSIATKKAFQNEKTEIFALDYDAVANILNDAIAENENEFRTDPKTSKIIARAISDSGYGEHSVMVFGKRKLKIIARNLDLKEQSGNISSLKKRLECITGVVLSEPSFELSFGSVNMQLESVRSYSADCAFSSSNCDNESICGDTVSIFENKNDYLYALISDGMGTGRQAALASEISNTFLRNMLTAGNRMETSLRMLNSVLRSKTAKSEDECSATIDLLQLDLYSGALTLVKSGAAPTFVLRRENVFKLSSPSFPIGILRSLDAKQLSINCEDGDLVVMISDGAVKNGDDFTFITNLLNEKNIADESASKIADKIVRRARAEADLQNDDISVVVIKVKKEVCNW